MKRYEVPKSDISWDRYKAFHAIVGHGNFVQFETGELAVRNWSIKPNHRHHYPDLDVSLTSPSDNTFRFTLADGTPCPIAWLTTHAGSPHMLVDHKTSRAVAVNKGQSHHDSKFADGLPYHLTHARAWMLSDTAVPNSAETITISRPYKMSKERKATLAELGKICNVFDKVSPTERSKMDWEHRHRKLDLNTLVGSVAGSLDELLDKSVNEIFANMKPAVRSQLAMNGYMTIRENTEVDYVIAERR